MEWPSDIIDAFRQVPFQPKPGETKDTVVQHLLDQTAKYAIWRTRGKPENLPAAYEAPYTPLGYMSVAGLRGKVKQMTMGAEWCTAVETLYEYVRGNVQAIMQNFEGQGEPYPDDID